MFGKNHYAIIKSDKVEKFTDTSKKYMLLNEKAILIMGLPFLVQKYESKSHKLPYVQRVLRNISRDFKTTLYCPLQKMRQTDCLQP